ncbi:DUF4240 domain-containing protein [Flavobacterium branchiophilum]|uniref:Uncharacterized protein n=1 Tax=Flavobacterium branchiophilum (strain FL-15) TaxID=1034807 RepID=G2Z4Q6_FLABF|nr:hypothetical protein [Flavobacterium branchiophilum]CCB68542.1 Protein of unknown function [Flavobacterium branchiophilum FL-15]
MTTLPQDIKERFYKTIKGEISLDDFEQWLYADKELEKYLNSNDYLDLISLSFKKSSAKYDLWNLLKKHIDHGEFETYKMLELLNEAKQKTDRLPYILMEFYDLYCKGYNFFQDLGIGIGLAVEVPRVNNTTADTYDELTSEQQKELLDSFSPELEECIKQVIYWLETKKIILTGEQDEIGHYEYEDLRTEEEKKSKLWVTVSEDKGTGFSASKNTLWDKQTEKKWWEFCK